MVTVTLANGKLQRFLLGCSIQHYEKVVPNLGVKNQPNFEDKNVATASAAQAYAGPAED